MYPTMPVEVVSGAVSLVCCFFTLIAVLTLAITSRG